MIRHPIRAIHRPPRSSRSARTIFSVMGMPVLRGRGLLPTNDNHAVKIAVVDELLARRFFAGRDPIGRRITSPVGFGIMEIVGVVPTVKENGLNAEDLPAFYVPYAQILDSTYVRAANNSDSHNGGSSNRRINAAANDR